MSQSLKSDFKGGGAEGAKILNEETQAPLPPQSFSGYAPAVSPELVSTWPIGNISVWFKRLYLN